jgi:hypothetical protein
MCALPHTRGTRALSRRLQSTRLACHFPTHASSIWSLSRRPRRQLGASCLSHVTTGWPGYPGYVFEIVAGLTCRYSLEACMLNCPIDSYRVEDCVLEKHREPRLTDRQSNSNKSLHADSSHTLTCSLPKPPPTQQAALETEWRRSQPRPKAPSSSQLLPCPSSPTSTSRGRSSTRRRQRCRTQVRCPRRRKSQPCIFIRLSRVMASLLTLRGCSRRGWISVRLSLSQRPCIARRHDMSN